MSRGGGVGWRDFLSSGPLLALLGVGLGVNAGYRWVLILLVLSLGLAAHLIVKREEWWNQYNRRMNRRRKRR